jgi:hypothetical protein
MPRGKKSQLQNAWDNFAFLNDHHGFNDHAAVARFLHDAGDEVWPTLKEDNLKVAYKLIGGTMPSPQGKPGYIAAIRLRISALLPEDAVEDNIAAPMAEDLASDEPSQAAVPAPLLPAARAARKKAAVPMNTAAAMSSDELTTTLKSFFSSIDMSAMGAQIAQEVSSAVRTANTSTTSSVSPMPSPPPVHTSVTAVPSSQSVIKGAARRQSQRDTVTISDDDNDSDADTDDKPSMKDIASKYVDSCLQTLRSRNQILTQHEEEYNTNVGWKNKRHRHEAIEIARIYDAAASESLPEIKRRLIARYVALEEFDSTGNAQVFDHIQTAGYSLLGNSIKHQLHRAVKRSTIGTAPELSQAPRQHGPRHNINRNHNNNNNHHHHNNNNNNTNNSGNGRGVGGSGGGGGDHGGRRHIYNKHNKPNGHGAVNQDGAGPQ